MQISEKIKFIRESVKLSQKEFAEKLNITQSTVSKYEKNERMPDFNVLKNLFFHFNINPNWIFFDIEPAFIEIDNNGLSQKNAQLLQDISLVLNSEQINIELNKIFFEHAIRVILEEDSNQKSPFRKFLEAVKLEGDIAFRPLLFLYYIFSYIRDNKNEIEQIQEYKSYLIDLIKRYNVLSFKNQPAFTSQIKKQFEASIDLSLKEEDCKRLIVNYETFLKSIESKMSPLIIMAHKKVDTTTLFPKKTNTREC